MEQQRMVQKTVLVVEDSVTQALHLQLLLEKAGLDVLLASDGLAGLQCARKSLPDLVILDMHMPEMDGMEVCRALKSSANTVDIPVIMFTSCDEEDAVILTLQLGAVDFIPKDVFADVVLLETLRQMAFIDELPVS